MQGAAFVEFVIDHIASRSRGWQLHATIAELQRALSDLSHVRSCELGPVPLHAVGPAAVVVAWPYTAHFAPTPA